RVGESDGASARVLGSRVVFEGVQAVDGNEPAQPPLAAGGQQCTDGRSLWCIMHTRLIAACLAGLLASTALAQDTLHVVPAAQLAIRDMNQIPWETLPNGV